MTVEDLLKLYREELARVQAERDAAREECRKLWAAHGLTRGAATRLLGVVEAAHECAENEEFLRDGTFDRVRADANAEIERADKMLGCSAATRTPL
jgi:hypothetical protein